MDLNKIEHIGIAVKSIEESLKYYEGVLGLKCYAIEEVVEQKVKTAFLKIGDIKLELLEATSDESPIAKFIEKRGEGVQHIAFAVNGIEKTLSEVKEKGIRLIDEKPRKGAEGLDIAFLHPKSTGGVLTEFCENNNITPDFHYTAPPLCILPYPKYNLEYQRLKNTQINNQFEKENYKSFQILKKEKTKFEECK